MSNGVVMTTLGGGGGGSSNTATVGESSNSDLTYELLEEDLSGICECGTCTLSSFLRNVSCPRPSSIPALSLPFLDLSHLNNPQRQLLLSRLYLEYKAIVNRFSQLTHAVQRYVLAKKTTFANFSKAVAKLDSFMPSLPQDEKTDEIKKCKSINRLFILLPDDGSFLSYHIFEDIVSSLKSAELKSKMSAYRKFLDLYCNRGIFECPSYSPTGRKGHSNFIVEVPRSRSEMNMHELLAIQEQLCVVLGVVSNTISLCNASKMQSGNIQVIFRVPDYVKDILIPLNAEQESSLRQLDFVGWSFYNGLDISYDPARLANQLLSSTDALTNSISEHISSSSGAAQATSTRMILPKALNMHMTEARQMDDMSSDDEDEEDSMPRKKLKPAPGKKTRGRVKIPMEYIKNKLRRYTTFSKRKSNIMKKAYELSTLTGTQVMLMVASETGHVYTFATPKLQPMITSEAGKALIQTCLHQPDPVSTGTRGGGKERTRMSSTGYEETELSGYLPRVDNGKNRGVPITSPLQLTSSNHIMPSVYTPPPPSLPLSLANELLPGGMLQSLVPSSSSHSLLPPPLISPDVFSPGGIEEEEGEHIQDHDLTGTHSPVS